MSNKKKPTAAEKKATAARKKKLLLAGKVVLGTVGAFIGIVVGKALVNK
jgi:hypothetical protein